MTGFLNLFNAQPQAPATLSVTRSGGRRLRLGVKRVDQSQGTAYSKQYRCPFVRR
jgi:hypothetical protein